jgi:hypothetical protein
MVDSGPIPTDFESYLRRLEKRLARLERRPVTMPTADLLGPGLAAQAVQIMDWSSADATRNGFYYTGVGGINVPDDTRSWTGQVIAKDDGTGMQQVWSADEAEPQQWTRTYAPDGQGGLLFTEWKRFLTSTGFIGTDELAPSVNAAITAGGVIPDPTGTSPNPTTEEGPASVLIRYPALADPRWVVDLHYTRNDSDTVGPATLHTENIKPLTFVYRDTAGTILNPDDEHFFALVVRKPGGGSAAASAWVEGRVGQIKPENLLLLVGDLIATRLSGEVIEGVTMKGTRYEIGNEGAYIDDEDGLVFPQPDGTEIRLPVDGSLATISTALNIAKELILTAGGNVQGVLKMLGTFLLTNGVPDPTGYPEIVPTWPIEKTITVADAPLFRGLCDSPDGLSWVTARRYGTANGNFYAPVLQRFSKATGALEDYASLNPPVDQVFGVTRVNNLYYALVRDIDDGNLWVHVYDVNLTHQSSSDFPLLDSSGFPVDEADKDSMIGTNHFDGTLMVLIPHLAGANTIYNKSTAGAHVDVDSLTVTSEQHAAYVAAGNFDYGVFRQIAGYRTALGYRAYSSAGGAEIPADSFSPPAGISVRGGWWDGTRFWSLDSLGNIYKHGTSKVDRLVKGAHAWVDDNATGGKHTTLAGPISPNVTIPKRAYIKMVSPPPPEADKSTQDAANGVQPYLSLSTDTPTSQGTPMLAGLWSRTLDAITTGNALPVDNDFPAITGELETEAGGVWVDGAGNGSVGTAGLRDSVRAALDGDYSAGAWTAYTPTFTAATTNPTLGNFTREGRWTRLKGKTIKGTMKITCNAGSGFGTGAYEFGLPVPARDLDHVLVFGAQTGPTHAYIGRGETASTVRMVLTENPVNMNSVNSGMASGTIIRIDFEYEGA